MKKLVCVVAVTLVVIGLAAPSAARPGGGQRFSSPSPSPRSYTPSPSPRPYTPSPSPRPSPDPSPRWSPSPSPAPWSPSPSPYSGGSDYSPSYPGGSVPSSSPATVFVPLLAAVLLFVFGVAIRVAIERRRRASWETAVSTHIEPATKWRRPAPVAVPDNPRRHLVELLSERDPEFSLVIFEDFLYALFTAYHEARGGSRRHDVTPYVEGDAERFLEAGKKDDVRSVIVGAMTIENARDAGDCIAVEVSFEANYEEVEDGRAVAYYAVEKWVLQRGENAKSRSPERASIDECPNCGGALADLDGNVCSYCKEALTPGRFDWAVTHISATRETRGPMLTGEVAEIGTDYPTVTVDGARERFKTLAARDTRFSWPAFQQRVKLVFDALHDGWTSRDWRRVRPFVTDQLFQAQLYWIEEYKRQKLNNRTDGARIVDVVMSNVDSDKHFDAITVRVFATGKDYTVDDSGKLVTGSKTYDRQYTEYWTFVRGRAASGETHTDPSCPNCGAPVAVNMAGACEHCDVKVTRGDFDWVLSRIEQDESYR